MTPTTRDIKRAIKPLPFCFYVRNWKDGKAWVMPADLISSNEKAQAKVVETLKAAGFECSARGTPGTSGEYTVEVAVKNG